MYQKTILPRSSVAPHFTKFRDNKSQIKTDEFTYGNTPGVNVVRETVSGKTQCFMLVPGEVVTYQVNPWDALEGHPQWDVKPTKDTATLQFKFKPLDNTVLPT